MAPNSNPSGGIPGQKFVKLAKRLAKRPPPAAPAPGQERLGADSRLKRMGLDTYVYNCHACGIKRKHSSGYMFVVMLEGVRLHFCDVNCCDNWEDNVAIRVVKEPVTDRRGAIAATRAKNEKDDPRT